MGVIYDLSKYAKSKDPDLDFPVPELLHQKTIHARVFEQKIALKANARTTDKKHIA